MEMNASEFKAHCLEILDRVRDHKIPIIITKRGKPVARLIPFQEGEPEPILGCLTGSGRSVGDIVSPIEGLWGLEG